PLFNQPMILIENLSGRINLVHVILFAWIAAASAVLWPRRIRRSVLVLLGVAVASEVIQILAPGRDPLLRDVFFDLAGVALGLGLGIAMSALFRRDVPTTASSPRAWLACLLRGELIDAWPEASAAVAAASDEGVTIQV